MLCAVIKGPSFALARKQLIEAIDVVDLVELRLDCFETLDLKEIQALCEKFQLPMIFTLRSQNEGGQYKGKEETRLLHLDALASIRPAYLDLEFGMSKQWIEAFRAKHPSVKVILSYHQFDAAPLSVQALYEKMQKIEAEYYKIAVAVHSSVEALQMLALMQNHPKLIAIGMGGVGQVSRILGPIFGCPITFAALEESTQSAPGQLTLHTLIELYQYRRLGSQTAIYGLIGDPVSRSIGHFVHNRFFAKTKRDAIYVKMKVAPHELELFLALAKRLGFKGLSVTMPLKEAMFPFLDAIDAEAMKIGAVNTLRFAQGKIIGSNTDGVGALNALETQGVVRGKRMVILGAGGAARAIAYEAMKRGAHVTVLNRDANRAKALACSLGCVGDGLDAIKEQYQKGYDLIVHCTSAAMPIAPEYLLPGAIAMDIATIPQETVFLCEAKTRGCRIIFGYRMFFEQAKGQGRAWFSLELFRNLYSVPLPVPAPSPKNYN